MHISILVTALFLVACLAVGAPSPRFENYQLRSHPTEGVCNAGVKQMSGYLDTADDKHFFYWFFEAQNKSKDREVPTVVWLSGGPGCSSLLGALTELGPCLISDDGNSTIVNQYGWNQNANLLIIDQPIGTGYSYGTPVSNSTAAADDFIALLKLFYKKYPEYYNGGLHIFGESFAGHFIPAIAHSVLERTDLPLKSIGIGNALINPRMQNKYYAKMACNSTYAPVLSQETCRQMEVDSEFCAQKIDSCFASNPIDEDICTAASDYCIISLDRQFRAENPLNNPYDVRTECNDKLSCFEPEKRTVSFLNSTAVQKSLHAKATNFQGCTHDVQRLFIRNFDMLRSYEPQLIKVLDSGLPTLLYVGDADWICNWYGIKATLMDMDWSGKAAFNNAEDKTWAVEISKAGEVRVGDNLTFVRVFGAGHMVPYSQPAHALNLINRWLAGEPFA